MENLVDLILSDFQIEVDGVILVHDYNLLHPLEASTLNRIFQDYLSEGTYGVFGDHTLNEHVGLNPVLQDLSTQERLVLGSGTLLQLLTLDADTHFASHPAHLIGFKGKYGPYLARSFDLDFPYGPVSIYNDLYGMGSVVIHFGDIQNIPELKHVYAKRSDAVIQKNTVLKQGEIKGYLDYDVDETILINALKDLDIIKSYLYEGVEIFAYDYAELIDALRLCDL